MGGNRVTHTLWQVKTFLFKSGRERVYGKFEEFYEEDTKISWIRRTKKFLRTVFQRKGHRLKKGTLQREIQGQACGRYHDAGSADDRPNLITD